MVLQYTSIGYVCYALIRFLRGMVQEAGFKGILDRVAWLVTNPPNYPSTLLQKTPICQTP